VWACLVIGPAQTDSHFVLAVWACFGWARKHCVLHDPVWLEQRKKKTD
jgi:hypothetical protein